MTLTVTVVAAFRNSFQAAVRANGSKWAAQAHADEVASAADWAGTSEPVQNGGLGFTVHASHGGGAGWDTEVGVTFVFAGLEPSRLDAVRAFAEALRAREDQDAVLFLTRAEEFALVSRPRTIEDLQAAVDALEAAE